MTDKKIKLKQNTSQNDEPKLPDAVIPEGNDGESETANGVKMNTLTIEENTDVSILIECLFKYVYNLIIQFFNIACREPCQSFMLSLCSYFVSTILCRLCQWFHLLMQWHSMIL